MEDNNEEILTSKDDNDERMWATFCHASTFAGYLMPFGNIIGPLVIWLIKKDEYNLVDDQGKEAINFQISISIYMLISIILFIVLIGIFLFPTVILFNIIATIIAIVNTNSGKKHRYPLTIRFIK